MQAICGRVRSAGTFEDASRVRYDKLLVWSASPLTWCHHQCRLAHRWPEADDARTRGRAAVACRTAHDRFPTISGIGRTVAPTMVPPELLADIPAAGHDVASLVMAPLHS